jgi:hypothetical protein
MVFALFIYYKERSKIYIKIKSTKNYIKSITKMAEYLEKEVVSRLKKIPCKQKNCKSQNLDNIDIIVFNCKGI